MRRWYGSVSYTHLDVYKRQVLNSAFGNGKNKGKVTISPPVKLYFDILRVFDNELLINLYWQCLRYLKFLSAR